MPALLPATDLLGVVGARFADHPWARLCVASATPYEGGWDLGDTVLWRSGHPWSTEPVLHALGATSSIAGALRRQGRPDGEVLCPVAPADPRPGMHQWTLRLRREPCVPQPGEERVRWLPGSGGVAAALGGANPAAEVRPGDPRAGRWCGVSDDGRLAAVAVETVLAAPRGHLSSLAVDPAARGRGLGAAVTAWFVRQALDGGAPEVLLGVDAGNAAADRLYDRLGFDAWPMGSFRPQDRG